MPVNPNSMQWTDWCHQFPADLSERWETMKPLQVEDIAVYWQHSLTPRNLQTGSYVTTPCPTNWWKKQICFLFKWSPTSTALIHNQLKLRFSWVMEESHFQDKCSAKLPQPKPIINTAKSHLLKANTLQYAAFWRVWQNGNDDQLEEVTRLHTRIPALTFSS